MPSRRNFVKSATFLAIMSRWKEEIAQFSTDFKVQEKVNWEEIRSQFPIINWEKINLNSGSAGVMPSSVSDHLVILIRYLNSKAPYEVWDEWQHIKKDNIARLSLMIKCSQDEIQVVRNTTEALNMIIYGLRFNQDDEIIVAEHDYGFALNAWKNRANRDHLKLREISVDFTSSKEAIIESYRKAITKRTRVVHLTHMTHRLGYIMPIKPIIAIAHNHGAEVVLDGAHVLGQINVDIEDINCDYFASSMHKWLNAPHGTGLLFVKKEKISALYNFPSSYSSASDKMEKFEHLGTRSFANEIGVSAALDFHDLLGAAIKTKRLQELKEYWTNKVSKFPGVTIFTPKSEQHSCAIASMGIEGITNSKLREILDEQHDIHVKLIRGNWGEGIRVSVNIFTNFEELDVFVDAIEEIITKKDNR